MDGDASEWKSLSIFCCGFFTTRSSVVRPKAVADTDTPLEYSRDVLLECHSNSLVGAGKSNLEAGQSQERQRKAKDIVGCVLAWQVLEI